MVITRHLILCAIAVILQVIITLAIASGHQLPVNNELWQSLAFLFFFGSFI